MDQRIQVKYDRKLFESINRQFWFHSMSWARYFIFGPIFVAVPIAAYFTRRWYWSAYIVSAFCIYYALGPLRSYIATMRVARKKFSESGDTEMTYHLTDDSLAIESSFGRAETYLKGLFSILKFRGGWILQFSHGLNVILPLRYMDTEIAEFIEKKLADNLAAQPKTQPVFFRSNDY